MKIIGAGDFATLPGGETDLMLQDDSSGQLEIIDANHNPLNATGNFGTEWEHQTFTNVGQIGLEWQPAAFAGFSENPDETDMLMRNSNSGAFELYDIANNQITSATSLGQVGLEWEFSGTGDFSSQPGEADFMMRNVNNGDLEIYDVAHNQLVSATPAGQIGLEWGIVAFGDFRNLPNETDMEMYNSVTGLYEDFSIQHNQIVGTYPPFIQAVASYYPESGSCSATASASETQFSSPMQQIVSPLVPTSQK
jgi:hypothetical protein